jgi:hypothetical protein
MSKNSFKRPNNICNPALIRKSTVKIGVLPKSRDMTSDDFRMRSLTFDETENKIKTA